jgi:uncharacterized membrane protein
VVKNVLDRTSRGRWSLDDKYDLYALAAITVLGAAIRVAYLFQPLKLDEISTFFAYTRGPLLLALTKNTPPNNQLLHTLLVKLSISLFGLHDWSIRFPAFLAGVLLIPLTYYLFKQMFNRWSGLIAAGLVAASSPLIDYSTNARGYTLQAMLFMILIIIAIHLKRARSTWGWAGFALVGTLCFFALPTTLYFFGAVAIWLGLSAIFRDVSESHLRFLAKLAVSAVATAVMTVLLYLPLVFRSGLQSVTSNPMVQSLPYRYFFEGTWKLALDTWKSWNIALNPVITIVLLAGFIVAVVFHRKISDDKVDLALVIVGWVAIALIAQHSVSFIRTWLPLLPVYFGFAAAGLYYAGSRLAGLMRRKERKLTLGAGFARLVIVLFAVFLAAMVVGLDSPDQSNLLGVPSRETSFLDAKKVASALKQILKPGDIVYVDNFIVPTTEYYLEQEGVPAGYLYSNNQGAENVSTPKRIIIVEAFSEGHTIDLATGNLVSSEELQRARIIKTLGHSKIYAIEKGS